MKKSNKNVIEKLTKKNYVSMSQKTKESLFKVSNAVFGDKKEF